MTYVYFDFVTCTIFLLISLLLTAYAFVTEHKKKVYNKYIHLFVFF